MLSTFSVMRSRIYQQKAIIQQRRGFNRHKSFVTRPQDQLCNSIQSFQEGTATGPGGLSALALGLPSSPIPADKSLQVKSSITNLHNRGAQSYSQSSLDKSPRYIQMEPEMFHWLMAALLITWGQQIAAFILVILCVDLDRLNDNWLAHMSPAGRSILIRRELCVLFISALLIPLRHEKSAVALFLLGTHPEGLHMMRLAIGYQIATYHGFLDCICTCG